MITQKSTLSYLFHSLKVVPLPALPDRQTLESQVFVGYSSFRLKQESTIGAFWEERDGGLSPSPHGSYYGHFSFYSSRQLFGLLLCSASPYELQFPLTTTTCLAIATSGLHLRSQGFLQPPQAFCNCRDTISLPSLQK